MQAIVDGKFVEKIEHRNYMVSIRTTRNEGDFTFPYESTGTIISDRKIVSTAHSLNNVDSVKLIFGTIDLNQPFLEMEISLDEITKHPEFSVENFKNDISVIQLKKKLKFNSKIDKIDMVDEGYVAEPGARVTMLGYSVPCDAYRSYNYSNLRYVHSKIADFDECWKSYWGGTYKSALNGEKQFCVSLRDGKHNTNVGDSGG